MKCHAPSTKIVNKTHYPQREVRRLVEFAGRELPSNGTIRVNILYSKARGGGVHGNAESGWRINIWLPHPKNFLATGWKYELLRVAAHELRHAYDYREYGGRDAWYGEFTGRVKTKRGYRLQRDTTIGRERERKARAFENYITDQWKKLHPDKKLTSSREELATLRA